MTYSCSGSARLDASSSQLENRSRMTSRAAAELRASDSPPGSVCSYSLLVVFSQAARACQYSALNRHTQLKDPGTHGSSQTRSPAPPLYSPTRGPPTPEPVARVTWTASESAAVTSPATSVSGLAQRRRSTASSKPATEVTEGPSA